MTFLPEDTVRFVNILTADDVIHEEDDQLIAVLEAGSSGVRLGNYTATATILDNDGNIIHRMYTYFKVTVLWGLWVSRISATYTHIHTYYMEPLSLIVYSTKCVVNA